MKVKCPVCDTEVEIDEAVYNTKTKRYYHSECYEQLLDRKKLYDYVCSVYDIKRPSNKIFSQINNYYKSGMSYSDMLLAFRYYLEIKKGSLERANGGIGIVPYVIHEAKEYYSLEELEQKRLLEKFVENKKRQKEPITKIIKDTPAIKNKIDIENL